jgi:hypothetical protein
LRDGASALGLLTGARTEFERSWARTCSVWDDAVQRAFEREHIKPILKQVIATQTELEHLLQTVSQARRHVH